MDNIKILVAVMILAFIIVAWLVFAETVKNPEKFVARIDGKVLNSIDIYDNMGKLLYSAHYSDVGDTRTIIVPNCDSFVVCWEDNKICGITEFMNDRGEVVKKTLGTKSRDFESCSNTDQIRR